MGRLEGRVAIVTGAAQGIGAVFLVAVTALGVQNLQDANTDAFGSYWDAMDRVNRLARIELGKHIGAHLT